MKFIEQYWNPEHILCKSRQFFEWQHYYHGEVCFVVAENNCSHELEGIVGYIPYSEEKERDVFGALWKVRNKNYPMLGLKMKLYLMRSINARTLSGIGLNAKTQELHRRSGSFIGKLKHYYLLADLEEYKIAHIVTKMIPDYNRAKEQFELMEIKESEQLRGLCEGEKQQYKSPRKSFDFFSHRYLQHPVYQYQFWGVQNGVNLLGVFVTRDLSHNSSCVLRIVDYIGDIEAIANTGAALRELVRGYEYIDFYLYGIRDNILLDAGFTLKQDDDSNIIPNYFEPFVQKNVSLDFYADSLDDIILFKGDGDQDRPNFITGGRNLEQ
ncbi:hypothetical protein [Parabacteroides sp.]|uniref:hypothetical protein n=1 Tax=Parabacteroides sp. TaxID=1869337 RepID=UPI00257EC754|nr:hypothetical protein [Parabacteroides sp.]